MLKKLPIIKDVVFVLKWLKWPSRDEVSRKAWIVGVLMLAIGLIGFSIHTIMSLV